VRNEQWPVEVASASVRRVKQLLFVVLIACGGTNRHFEGIDADTSHRDAPAIDAPADAMPPDMVAVPAGPFMMGCDTCDADEAPAHSVMMSTYLIDKTEVTQGAYAMCVAATTCTVPSANYDPATKGTFPVSNVTWDQAVAYCAFAGKHLPTEAEWEKAARGTDGRTYPWGNTTTNPCTLANIDTCGGTVSAVGLLPAGASPYGALDMAGNLWEWTHDYYAADAYATTTVGTDPTGPTSGTQRVYRGGSSGNTIDLARTSNRANTYSPTVGGSGLGFRCAQ